ncbi:MAG TPA: TraR/DksA C4-type zinc finger protein [Acidimicrobiales bacterium]|nr:TraR/DksA C4-type zinc finger protein [Acidimicrobiales bacterium]
MAEAADIPRRKEPSRESRDPASDEARTLLAEAERDLRAIEVAMERLAGGTYSTCELCGSPIEPERLAVAPTERTCAAHDAPN